ncbi:response regulator transcription factor [Methylobacillus arboreus]|uniref:response regulator transcription factor n=1 Tax=Methylobacillus arboreus TaxID=755170 RepID=UPI001E3E1D18|nr:response regulator transcription factor [Methylobacillus arboreus]MCB5189513.1 response regulator transcription factor [Methylobacillus arboreus]
MEARKETAVVLIVDDVPDNLAVLHDALDESGYMVLVANNGETALQRAEEARPDIILLDAIMPGLDGFEVCARLKANLNTRHIPVIFMTGLTESEHVVAGFAAGGTDYVTKPIRTAEVIARISTHLQASRQMHQARGALDAFGQAAIAVLPSNGRIVWQTPLARDWMQRYFSAPDIDADTLTPLLLLKWLDNLKSSGTEANPLMVVQGSGRLIFSPADLDAEGQWIILLREESDAAQIEALMQAFGLTQRESEVLYWAIKGKTNRDIGDILGTSPRTVNKHMEHVFAKLGVETRTAAAALATSKMRNLKAG